MLRPATPLTLLLLIAFVLLLLSVISTPIVRGIPLASFEGRDFGVFGYCKQGTQCPKIQVGYNADTLTGQNEDQDFSLPPSARSSLSSILIVHPVAAFLTLTCFILAALAHLHSPSHSPRYLLALLILLLPTLLITLLAFLVDILLFVPHLAWGGWIVLASTILITASGVVTCAMRRTLVSRKARKKRIEQNAEMNGEIFYNRQNATEADAQPPNPQQIMPTVDRISTPDQLPAFTTYDSKSQATVDDDQMPLNARTPSNRTAPSSATRVETSEDGSEKYGAMGRASPGGMRGGYGGSFNAPRDEFGNLLPPSNAFGPSPLGASRKEPFDPRMTHQYSNDTMNSQGSRGRGRGGYPGRGFGRGGPYGPGRGSGLNGSARGIPMGPLVIATVDNGMGNRRQDGAPPGYGNGYPPDGRAFTGHYNGDNIAAGPGGSAMNAREQSSPGYGGSPPPGPSSAPLGYGRQPPLISPVSPEGSAMNVRDQSSFGYGGSPPPVPSSAAIGYGRQPPLLSPTSPGGYVHTSSPGAQENSTLHGRGPSPGPPSAPGANGYVAREPPSDLGAHSYQAASPAPPPPELRPGESSIIGQAVEMDALTGSPSQNPPLSRNNDVGVPGLAGMHQNSQRRDSPMSMTSIYSTQEAYVPPRAAWAAATARRGTPPQNFARPLSPIHASPVELPTPQNPGSVQIPMHTLSHSPPPDPDMFPPSPLSPINPPSHVRHNSSSNYYEDVDPRFSNASPPPSHPVPPIPRSLTPGGGNAHELPSPSSNIHPPLPGRAEPSNSYEATQEGARSPTIGDVSNYTSVSQRGVTSHWRSPPPPGGVSSVGNGGTPNRRTLLQQLQQQQQRPPTDVLQTNPDFELPRSPAR